ncbi:MAG TPA: 2-dehydropantoate 2-reductase [Bdellovibrionota bacterium]|nr:2-dehydropantoate 2-reductase [Bdellovibrionota bacterium]
MRFVFLGVGGVGGYFASRLAQAGVDVAAVVRGAHREAIAKKGLRYTGFENAEVRIQTFDHVKAAGTFDVLVLGLKCTDLENALQSLEEHISSNVTFVTLQNGVDAEEICSGFFPKNEILGGVVYIDAKILEPGVLEVTSPGRLALGKWGAESSRSFQSILDAFQKSDVQVSSAPDIRLTKWKKLSWNAVFNPLCLLTRLTVGEIRKQPSLADLGHQISSEVMSVAQALGIRLAADYANRFFSAKDDQGSGILHTRTSMWSDFVAGKPTEIDFLNGAVVRHGASRKVPTPINQAIVTLVHALETSRTGSESDL